MKHEIEWFNPTRLRPSGYGRTYRNYKSNGEDRFYGLLVISALSLIPGGALSIYWQCAVQQMAGPWPLLIILGIAMVVGYFLPSFLQTHHKFYGYNNSQINALQAYDRLPVAAKSEIPNLWDTINDFDIEADYSDRNRLNTITERMQSIRDKHDRAEKLEKQNPAIKQMFHEGLTRALEDADSRVKTNEKVLREIESMR